jgi:hypothetical protein
MGVDPNGAWINHSDHAARVRELEEALELACMSHVATTDALTSDCYEAKANSKTQIELRARAAKAAARLYDNPTTKAMLAKLASAAMKEAANAK